MRQVLLLTAVLLAICCRSTGRIPGALYLDFNTFAEVSAQHALLLVNYYASWCGFCKSLEDELRLVVKDLAAQKIPAVIAMVDGSIPENEALAGPLGLSGSPSLILYRHGERISDYYGGRSRWELVEYLRRKSGAPVEPVSTVAEINGFLDELGEKQRQYQELEQQREHEQRNQQQTAGGISASSQLALAPYGSLVLGLFLPAPKGSGRGPYGRAAQAYTTAAQAYDYAKFLVADNLDIIKHFGVVQDTMIVFSGGQATYTGLVPLNDTMDSDTILYSLLTFSLPPVITYDSATQPLLRTLPVRSHVLLFHDTSAASSSFLSIAEDLARSPPFRGKLIFIKVPAKEHQLLQAFGLQPKDLPEAVLADMSDTLTMRRHGLIDFLLRRSGGAPIIPPAATTPHPSGAIIKDLSIPTFELFLETYLSGALPRSIFSEDPQEVEKQLHASRTKLRLRMQVSTRAAAAAAAAAGLGGGASGPAAVLAANTANGNFPFPGSNIRAAVGSTFAQVVAAEPSVDVFVYIFVPWCAHCKAFEAVFEEMVSTLLSDRHISFIRIDGSKNEIDHPAIRVRGYPSIFLFKAFEKDQPIEYDGVRSTPAISAFLSDFRGNIMGTAAAAAAAGSETGPAAAAGLEQVQISVSVA